METLPPEIIISILGKCSREDLQSIQYYCSAWADVLDDDRLFLRLFFSNEYEGIWRKVFPAFPTLHGSFIKNSESYEDVVRHAYLCFWSTFVSDSNIGNDFLSNTASLFALGETPVFNIADFERYIYEIVNSPTDLVRFLTYVIELHNWPFCFAEYRAHLTGHGIYWQTICDALTRGPYPGTLRFLEKYKRHIIWKTRELYRYLNVDFLVRNKDIWRELDWSSILVKVNLNEELLENILEVNAQNEPWYAQWPNISYICAHQHLSEGFIEKWFIDTKFDNPTNWSNILRCQHISTAFKDKYEYKSGRRRR